MRRTKIIATLGPASEVPEVLGGLASAGLDVVRLNASHGGPSSLQPRYESVRELSRRSGRAIGVLLDLGGPKLRVGDMREGTTLEPGQGFELLSGETCVGDRGHACINYRELASDVRGGDRVLLDDGRIRLKVRGVRDHRIQTEVEVGGPLTSRKGVNVPGVRLSLGSLTEKDLDDLRWGLRAGVDMVAQSFVRSADDVHELRERMGERRVPVVAKIEKYEAVRNIPEIVAAADAVMVARGDLGVETSPEEVPVIQRRIIETCRDAGKPVIIATQMLESMVSSPSPTRAEASDVANAVFDEVDAVMLSAETAVGDYPVEAVRAMARIAQRAEESLEAECEPVKVPAGLSDDVTQAVSEAACDLASRLHLKAILTPTQSGATARAVAAHRTRSTIVALTPEPAVQRQLTLVWGVVPLEVERPESIDDMIRISMEAAVGAGLVESGDLVALTAGVAVNVPGSTNLVQVRRIP